MRTRRGSEIWVEENEPTSRFQVGYVVTPLAMSNGSLNGIVTAIDTRLNLVWVSWGAQADSQHNPNELVIDYHQTAALKEMQNPAVKVASRRGVASEVKETEKPIEASFKSRRATMVQV